MEEETTPELETQEFQDVETEVDTTNGENVEQPSETEELEPQTQEVATEPTESEVEVEEVEEPDQFDPSYETPEFPQIQPVDINQFVDENGQIDMIGYNRAMTEFTQAQVQAAVQTAVSQSTQQVSRESQYRNDWAKAEKLYPQLSKDKELRDMVRDIHAQSATPGRKYLSPAKAAEQLMKRFGAVKAEGAKSAQQTRTVQAAAALTNPNPPVDASDTKSTSKLKDKMRYGNKAERTSATTDYIGQLIREGRI